MSKSRYVNCSLNLRLRAFRQITQQLFRVTASISTYVPGVWHYTLCAVLLRGSIDGTTVRGISHYAHGADVHTQSLHPCRLNVISARVKRMTQ